LCRNDDDDRRRALAPSLISIMSATALAYWKACSWYSSNMKTPYCSRVQKVVSSSTKEKPLDNSFPLDGGALALDDGEDWLGIVGRCSGVIEDILGCSWATEPVVAQFQQ
jgi:hypothetical protein